jgi:uncharacterized protein YPO0396
VPSTNPDSLTRKLTIKPDSPFYGWIEQELARRFDYVCCDSLEQFRRERQAVTRAGQVKSGGERHEKDDRHRLDDRGRYVLGWSNEGKIAALEKRAQSLEKDMRAAAARIAEVQAELKRLSGADHQSGPDRRIPRLPGAGLAAAGGGHRQSGSGARTAGSRF